MENTVVTAPTTATFQFRTDPMIRERAKSIYSNCGLTLTDAINIFIQPSINIDEKDLLSEFEG